MLLTISYIINGKNTMYVVVVVRGGGVYFHFYIYFTLFYHLPILDLIFLQFIIFCMLISHSHKTTFYKKKSILYCQVSK